MLANKGYKRAIFENKPLSKGLNVYNGKVVYKAVSDAFGMEHLPLSKVLSDF